MKPHPSDLRSYCPRPMVVGRVEILGCPVDPLTLEETVAHATRLAKGRAGATQVSINGLKIDLAGTDDAFRQALHSFDIASADGVSIVWAGGLLGRPLPGRVNGTDLMLELLAVAERQGLSVYFLGARTTVLDAAIARATEIYPELRVAGMQHGYFDPADEDRVVEQVAAAAPDFLFVALPSPRKEWFLAQRSDSLGVGFAMGIGGSLDVLAGLTPRAPGWMQRMGLEWLFRLIREPRRLWRRYLVTNARFVNRLGREMFRTRTSSNPQKPTKLLSTTIIEDSSKGFAEHHYFASHIQGGGSTNRAEV